MNTPMSGGALKTQQYPETWRILLALALAPFGPALVAPPALLAGFVIEAALAGRLAEPTFSFRFFSGVLGEAYFILSQIGPLSILVGAVMVVVSVGLGLPAYFLLRRRVRPTLVACAATGALTLLGYLVVANAVSRGWAYLTKPESLVSFAVASMIGAIGGVTFWAVMKLLTRQMPNSL